MGYSLSAQISGGDEIARALKKFPNIAEQEFKKAIDATSYHVEAKAVPKAPIKTGTLRRSIKTSRAKISKGNVTGKVGTKVHYAPHQEFGTRRGIKPKYFMRDASKASESFLIAQFKEAIRRITKRV